MKLTREKGMRMWGGGGGSSYSYGRGGGGESPSLDGFVSNEYYNQNFELLYKQEVTAGGTTTTTFMTAAPNIIVPVGTVTDETTQTTTVTSLVGPVAKNAIVLGNIMMVYDQTNNAIKVVNRDGSTAANFYATGGVSSLGYSPGGGGGGDTLTEPLDSINSASLGMPTAAGQVITWNGTQWIFDIPSGGGGGGTGTVTSITAGTGLSGGTITTMGTIAISSEYQGYIENGQTAYGWGNHANAGYLTQSSLIGYATQAWVNNQGFVTLDTAQNITATKTFTVYQDMRGINLNTQGDIRQDLPNSGGTFYLGYNAGGGSTGFNLAYSPDAVNVSQLVSVLPNGNVGIGNNSPSYKMDVSGNIHTSTAYYLDNKLFANNNSGLHIGYGFAAADLPTTLWGDEISFRSVDGTFGECTTIGNTYGIMGTDFIGVTNKFRFEYDSTNNTVWVLKADGTAVNFASFGGVTSLGVGSSGTPNISSMNIATLTTTNTTVGNQLHIGTSGTNNGQINFYDTNATDNASISVDNGDLHITSDSTTYIESLLSVDGNITADGEVKGTSLHTSGGNLTMGGGNILMGGGRIYLDATRYLYLNGSSLMYYNGTSSINVA